MVKVEMTTLTVKKEDIKFVSPSWQHALPMMSDTQFLRHIQWFGKGSEARPIAGKDLMNAETIHVGLLDSGFQTSRWALGFGYI